LGRFVVDYEYGYEYEYEVRDEGGGGVGVGDEDEDGDGDGVGVGKGKLGSRFRGFEVSRPGRWVIMESKLKLFGDETRRDEKQEREKQENISSQALDTIQVR
jgi:hypothetical protein